MNPSLEDLVRGTPALARLAGAGDSNAKLATNATDPKNPTQSSSYSNFRHTTSLSEIAFPPNHPGPDPQEQEDHRLWDVQASDGNWWSVSCTPPATRRALACSWPNALTLIHAPEDDPHP
jgi:hypothetical protein